MSSFHEIEIISEKSNCFSEYKKMEVFLEYLLNIWTTL